MFESGNCLAGCPDPFQLELARRLEVAHALERYHGVAVFQSQERASAVQACMHFITVYVNKNT
jgi:hypothetical protein